ncbi:ABC transporter permease [Lacimicrobium alkaliphilum]|uniref:Peptide ABC transporter permease n=1 Tax=Lacimicrobium alkaliphilum TaxID=1526571 RepID=A0ABQ1RAP6_9ALTE|nr:ABC transporter permease [Lacimicrobium alkaliphilum]GGD64091.1 peptide ABC transporter permease [Lacimicrobium alkaliphilum]
MLISLARASLWNRKLTVILTVLSIAVSTFIVLGVDHLKNEMKSSFSRTVSGVDLIVGARTGPTNLLLYSVFRIGNPTNNISWQSYQQLSQSPEVAWTVPISLGDSHKGYRVLGTTAAYFEHFKYGQSQSLVLKEGQLFEGALQAVVGAEVADRLGYQVGSEVVISHGTGDVSFTHHDAHPFRVTGILAPTGTPVDQTVHVSLSSIEVIHEKPQRTALSRPQKSLQSEQEHKHDHSSADTDHQHPKEESGSHQHSDNQSEHRVDENLIPDSVSAMLVGLKSRIGVLTFQRKVNQYQQEALLGIIPGVALSQLWQMMGMAERALALIALLVLVASMLGMTTMLLASMREREREIAVLRAIGAHASFVLLIIELEAVLIALAGAVLGYLLLTGVLAGLGEWITSEYGLFIGVVPLSLSTLGYLALIVSLAGVLALFPAWLSYRRALARGLSVRM